MSDAPIRYIAEPAHVREVSLLGTADLAFWRERIRHEGLSAAEYNGKAQILIIAATMVFKGVRFAEISFSLVVSGYGRGIRPDSALLLQAFNSSRLFAFCERVLFATPYLHGRCRVSVAAPVGFDLAISGNVGCRAELASGNTKAMRPTLRSGFESWDGPVFLPSKASGRKPGRFFFAKVSGDTRAFTFDREHDVFSIANASGIDIFNDLIESHFEPTEWTVRADATHGKAKTCFRTELPGAGE